MPPPYLLTDAVVPGFVLLVVAATVAGLFAKYLMDVLSDQHDDEGDEHE